MVIIVLAWLMVSNLPFLALKFRDYSFRNNAAKYGLIAVAVLAIIFLGWLSVPVIFVLYVVISLVTRGGAAKLEEREMVDVTV
jgi:CDP-diacylglycerol--serine O-phosphatidyltransferase